MLGKCGLCNCYAAKEKLIDILLDTVGETGYLCRACMFTVLQKGANVVKAFYSNVPPDDENDDRGLLSVLRRNP